jgi:hypothetical protein
LLASMVISAWTGGLHLMVFTVACFVSAAVLLAVSYLGISALCGLVTAYRKWQAQVFDKLR